MATINKREWTTKATGQQRVRWDAQVYLGRHPATGKPQFVSKTFHRKGDAEVWARKQESMMDDGTRPATTRETLAEYLTRWLDVYAGQVRAVTVYNYRTVINRWVVNPSNGTPPIGAIRLTKLTVKAFDELYRYMREQAGLQPRGVQYLHGILKRALKDAVRKGVLPKNPAEFATVPKADHTGEEDDEDGRVGYLNREQALGFLTAAKEDRYSALWHVLLTGGLRPCEAFALRWRDVEFDVETAATREDEQPGSVSVRRTLTRIGVDRKKHPLGWKVTKPKTKKSRRTVPLPAETMWELRKWRTQQKRDRFAVGSEWQEHGLVFTTQVGSPLDGSNLHRGSFRRVCSATGLGEWGPEPTKPRSGPTPNRAFTPSIRVYDLRHTFATLLLEDGEDLLVVSRLLGHSTYKLTADLYAHVTPERKEQAAARLDRMFAAHSA